MKGDFTRDTFDPSKHYQRVLMQQGRAQVDADWNEQAALTARHDETTTADIVGDCGGPADGAAFGVFTDVNKLSTAEEKHLQDLKINTPLAAGDFFLSAGRYYVAGIQCENEFAVPYTVQPDRVGVSVLTKNKSYLLYLDVWQRHITALEDGEIRESALGGPDTGTRVKTVWQVRALELGAVDSNNPCRSGANDFNNLFDPGTAMLTADTAIEQAPDDPCIVPPSAGYTGLENQLYRVEIHDSGSAIDPTDPTILNEEVTLPDASSPQNEITVTSDGWTVGEAVELYPSKSGSPVMAGQLAYITAVNSTNKKVTLNVPVRDLVADDAPRIRHIAGATWKWSRENGSVVAAIEKIDGNQITVSSLGPDTNLGFPPGAWVEIIGDAAELEGNPGQLAEIDDVDEESRVITLKSAPATLATNDRYPKLRRWDGVAAVKYVTPEDSDTNWLLLESGIQVRFASGGDYRTGHYWEIPARTATAQSPNGKIKWPLDSASNPIALNPKGITHHLCRLGIVTVDQQGAIDSTDCRCLYPALTAVPRLFYVGGAGQEVMPDLTAPDALYKLPQPLVVGVANAQCLTKPLTVGFAVTEGNGAVVANGGDAASATTVVEITTDSAGLASCDFYLDGSNWSQQVTAQLLDADSNPVSLPVIFDANLSIADQVAYDPKQCGSLKDQKTVQKALDELSALASLYEVSGNGQTIGANETLKPLVVIAANKCGAIAGMKVKFKLISAEGNITPKNGGTTDEDGLASCDWTLGPSFNTQEVEATLQADETHPTIPPTEVRFTGQRRATDGVHPGIYITDVVLGASGQSLPNDSTVVFDQLEKGGIQIVCNENVAQKTISDKPTCFVTLELPFPVTDADRDFWKPEGLPLMGFQPLILFANVNSDNNVIYFNPRNLGWMPKLFGVMKEFKLGDRVLARLTLKGNFIWSDKDPNLFLDGEAFGDPTGKRPTNLLLPSGDGQRGGDFEMWFWLSEKKLRVPRRVGRRLSVLKKGLRKQTARKKATGRGFSQSSERPKSGRSRSRKAK